MTCVVQFPSPDTVAARLFLSFFLLCLPLSRLRAPIATPSYTPTSSLLLRIARLFPSSRSPPLQRILRKTLVQSLPTCSSSTTFLFSPNFFFTFHFHPFFPLPAFSRSSFFRSPENSIFFTRPARPENTANPVSAQRAGEVQILGHLFSTSRTYETPFPPFPLTSMRPIATTSDRSRASLGGERFRRVDARLSTRQGRQAPTRNIRSSLV